MKRQPSAQWRTPVLQCPAESKTLWQLAYARGLGKEVIYTCYRQNHDECCLDIEHYWREPWDEDDLDTLADRLVKYIQKHELEAEPGRAEPRINS